MKLDPTLTKNKIK